MNTHPIHSHSLERFYYIDGEQRGPHYKEHLSDYSTLNQKEHADKWLVFPENISTHIDVVETSVANCELYTIITNKAARDQKGSVIAIVEGVRSKVVIQLIEEHIPQDKLNLVQEVALDMSEFMRKIVRRCFPNAIRDIDRIHVQILAEDALQEIRIDQHWDAVNEETNARKKRNSLKQVINLYYIEMKILMLPDLVLPAV